MRLKKIYDADGNNISIAVGAPGIKPKKQLSQACIETYTGLFFDILDPKPEQIVIEDIAHALSQCCRFTGHTKYPYSVAQHSILASYITPPQFAFEALMHDSGEAYIADLSRPVKHFTPVGPPYMEIEERIMSVIAKKFGFPTEMSPEVKRADNIMLYAEKKALMRPIEWPTKWGNESDVADVEIYQMTPGAAKASFLRRFSELTINRRIEQWV